MPAGWCDAAVLSGTMECWMWVMELIPLEHGQSWMKMEGIGSPSPLALLPSQQSGFGAAPITPLHPAFPEASTGAS